jgi:hypothetical protein
MEATAQSVPLDSEVEQTAPDFSRKHIRDDDEVMPLTLRGGRRAVYLAFYASVVAVAIGGTAYTLWVSPVIGLFGLSIFYVFNNVAFVMSHLRFHAAFIELPESRMDVLIHHSFIHHYRDSGVYHKTWLESRVSYFMDPKLGVFDHAFIGMGPLTFLTVWFLWRFSPVLGISFIAMGWGAQLLQSAIHEWYHNPPRNRRAFYNPVVYGLFTVLEAIGIASTRKHGLHHRHQLKNLNEVVRWLDLSVPLLERLPELVWKKALTKYVPGEERMSAFVKKVAFASYTAIHVTLVLAYLGVYALLQHAGLGRLIGG